MCHTCVWEIRGFAGVSHVKAKIPLPTSRLGSLLAYFDRISVQNDLKPSQNSPNYSRAFSEIPGNSHNSEIICPVTLVFNLANQSEMKDL